METKNNIGKVLVSIVILLVVAVFVQGYYLAKMYLGQKNESSIPDVQKVADVKAAIPTPVTAQSILPPVGIANQLQPTPGSMAMPLTPQLPQSLNQITPFDDFFANGDPFQNMKQMQEMMDRMMAGMAPHSGMGNMNFGAMNGFSSGMKITEDKDNYVVKMKIPGLDKSEIKTEVNGDMLTVTGTQKEELQNKVGNRIVSKSHNEQSFQTSFGLPRQVKTEDVKVEYEKDILTIRIPKA